MVTLKICAVAAALLFAAYLIQEYVWPYLRDAAYILREVIRASKRE
jgi:hypothetical protein